VGTKADLVEHGVEREVSEAELTKICEEAGAIAVKNTSSKSGANIQELFDTVVTEVTDRFQEDGPGEEPPQPLIKMGGSEQKGLFEGCCG
jgi:hypothetical protein